MQKDKNDPGVISDLLSLVGIDVPARIVALWTDEQIEQAICWAGQEHLGASDNIIHGRYPMPEFLKEWQNGS